GPVDRRGDVVAELMVWSHGGRIITPGSITLHRPVARPATSRGKSSTGLPAAVTVNTTANPLAPRLSRSNLLVRRLKSLLAAPVFWVVPLLFTSVADGGGIELKNGERIVLLGDDLIERDQKAGYLETALTLRNPKKDLTFRNLGWSGDTVFGDARARF